MAIDKIFDGAVDGIADNLFNSVSNSVSEIKAMQQRKAAENVQLVVQALKKIDADIREKYDGVTETFDKRIASIKDGRDGKDGKNGLDGVNGKDGRDGKDGRNGRDGLTGPRGFDGPKGLDGKDGRDGEDGVSVTDAHIDFDGSLIISLSSGRVINVGEVVAADIAEKIKVITNGGGTSQPVLDKLASLQEQIDLIASALVYKGTWNASTNTPALTSSVGTANSFYIVSVAGTTNLNGTSNWGVGDWAVFNGSVWQRVEGGAVGNFTDLTVSGTTTLSNLTASTALALNASKEVVSVTNTGSGNNVLATSPTLVTPALGTPSSATLTNATGLPLSSGVTGTLPIANGGTGQTTANTAFNALAPSQASNSGKYLTTNGTDTSWATLSGLGTVTSVSGTGTVNGLTLTGTVTTSGSLTLGGTLSGISNASLTNSSITINGTATSLGGSINVGTVTSVGATVPSFLSITGSPITSSGTLAISLSGTALPTTSGGTGLTSFTANGVVYASSTSALTTGSALTFDGTKLVNTGYNKSTYQVSTGAVGTFESVGAAYLTYDGETGASVYSRSNASAENTLTFRATAFSFRVAGTQVASLNSSTFSLQNIPILLSGSTSGYTGFAAPATSNFTIYTLPSTDGTSGQSLTTNGSGTLSWASGTGGTVTSVGGTGTVSGISLSGTVTSSGSLTLGGALDLSAYSGAGAFTTLSASSTVTLSGGTANGVTYLNGSKVVTSGSALTFDGSGVLTVGSDSVATVFNAVGDVAQYVVDSNGTGSSASHQWRYGSTEAMRLTSTGLGIGTSSPATKLQVYGGALTVGDEATYSARFSNNSNKGVVIGYDTTNNVGHIGSINPAVAWTDLVINANGGNLGLGVTPSASWATYKVLQIGEQGVISGFASGAGVLNTGANFYWDGSGYRYLTSNPASLYQQNAGGHNWRIASSGTAGNAITFTQAMTLDASGNLGIGTSSPAVKLDVIGGIKATIASTASNNIRVGNSGSNFYFATENSAGGSFCVGSLAYSGLLVSDNAIQLSTTNGGSVQATLTTSGNLGLGVTPSAWSTAVQTALQVYTAGVSGNGGGNTASRFTHGCYLDGSTWKYQYTGVAPTRYEVTGANAGSTHSWSIAAGGTAGNAITFTQAMSLLAGGNLLVGKTGADVSVNGFRVDPDGAIFSSIAAGNETNYVYNTSASAYRFYVNSAGTVFATTTTISAISDIRFKENVRDLDAGLTEVMALKPRLYDWKEGKGANIKNARGFIAQEFETVFPDLIDEWKDEAPEGEDPYKSVRQDLIPVLVKAIQEQQAIINQLKARLDAANL